jgi:hypothetical protein
MNDNKNKRSLEEIRDSDLVNYLASLGHQPEAVKKNGTDYWYLSPLRTEGEASFKVNRTKNRWFDFGLGQGGNLIDFGVLYFNCNVGEFLGKFRDGFSIQQRTDLPFISHEGMDEKDSKIIITGERGISSYWLFRYLRERHIPVSIANGFCREVCYELDGKSYYGIGLKNNAGGYEIRNAFFKCSSSPKDVTTIGSGSDEVHIFEGFFDFLSFKTIYQNAPSAASDCLILNGAAMFERARPLLEKYTVKRLWLDRDTTGLAYTKYALSLHNGYRDESGLYSQRKDLNEWLRHKGEAPKKRLRNKIS